MKALLIVQQGPAAGHSYMLDPQRQPIVSVGRSADCDMVVLDPLVSRHHCHLRWNGRLWAIVDQRSTGGTLLNGQSLRPQEPYALQSGDEVALGGSVLTLQPAVEPRPVATAAPSTAQRGRRSPLVPILVGAIAVVIIGVATSAALLLGGGSTTAITPEVMVVTRVITSSPLPTDIPPPASPTSPPPTATPVPGGPIGTAPTARPRMTHTAAPTYAPSEPVATRSATAIPASPSPAPTPDVAQVVQKEFERLAEGRILYNPPEEMQVGRRERIEARLSMDSAAVLEAGLVGEGEPQVEAIPISCFMKVRLQGETFEIVPLSSEEQVVPAEGYTEWSWDVTPEKSGERSLFLLVTARVKLSGYADEQKDLGIFERQIHIKVNPAHAFRSFLKDNQGWIYTAIMVPSVAALGRWLWKRYKKRSSSGKGKSEPAGKDTP